MHTSTTSSQTSSSRGSSPESQDTMQIFVKNVTGQTLAMTVPPNMRIDQLKALLSVRTSLPASDLRLVFAGRQLGASATLEDCNIGRESTLHMTLTLRGGMAPPKRARCSHKDCREFAQKIVGDCDFCGGKFCGKHRLLEDHACSGLEDCKKESHERNANQLEAERTTAIKGI